MTSVFSQQNSISLCPASFCTQRPNLPVTSGISWPTIALQSPMMKGTSFFSISVKLEWEEGKKEQNNKFLSRLWLWLWRNPECTWTTKHKQESWGSTSMRLYLISSQLWLNVQSIYIPFKVLKLCLKVHLGSLSSWGLSHFLSNGGNDTKVIQYLVWWIIGGVKLKNNENVSAVQFLNCPWQWFLKKHAH